MEGRILKGIVVGIGFDKVVFIFQKSTIQIFQGAKLFFQVFVQGGRLMFYFGLDLLSQSKLAWLGQLYTYQYILREPQWPWLIKCWTIEGNLQNTNLFEAITASTKCQFSLLFLFKLGHTKPILTTLNFLVNYFWFKTSENSGHWDESWDRTGLYLQFRSHLNLGFLFPSPKFLSLTEILRAFPRNIESKVSSHFRGIPQRIYSFMLSKENKPSQKPVESLLVHGMQ